MIFLGWYEWKKKFINNSRIESSAWGIELATKVARKMTTYKRAYYRSNKAIFFYIINTK
jgi:hypothetical protein